MLLTVQNIPDVSRKQPTQVPNHRYRQDTAAHTLQLPAHRYPYTVKRSQSCASQEENASVSSRLSVNTTGHIRDRCGDFYDTVSTTTTLTPTPSESGRETPQLRCAYNGTGARNSYTASQTQRSTTYDRRERDLIMDLQNQSHEYAQQQRARGTSLSDGESHRRAGSSVATAYSATSEDDESIPYHAREDSRPFTYGDPTGVQLSPGGSMIKSQSGLSSPSLVRKHLGRNTSAIATTTPIASRKNVDGRSEFEEMLMKRREKILNDKYSIGDSTPTATSVSASANKWNTSSPSINQNETTNGYRYHEPLKRSNTLDAFSGRGHTNGYVSDRWVSAWNFRELKNAMRNDIQSTPTRKTVIRKTLICHKINLFAVNRRNSRQSECVLFDCVDQIEFESRENIFRIDLFFLFLVGRSLARPLTNEQNKLNKYFHNFEIIFNFKNFESHTISLQQQQQSQRQKTAKENHTIDTNWRNIISFRFDSILNWIVFSLNQVEQYHYAIYSEWIVRSYFAFRFVPLTSSKQSTEVDRIHFEINRWEQEIARRHLRPSQSSHNKRSERNTKEWTTLDSKHWHFCAFWCKTNVNPFAPVIFISFWNEMSFDTKLFFFFVQYVRRRSFSIC